MQHSERLPAIIRFGFFWNKYGLRGRGYVPRQIGRKLVKEGNYIVQTRHNAKLVVDLSSLDIYATIFNSGGDWERHIAQNCQRLLRKSDVFFDIGANVGCISFDTKAALSEDVKMCLFEPQPSLAGALRASIAVNGFNNIEVFDFLLGDCDGLDNLYVTSHSTHASMIPRERAFDKITVPMWTIDTLVRTARCPPPDVIKIDTEGAELRIFRGMLNTLKDFSPSVLFEADSNMARFGYSALDLMTLLSSVGVYDFLSISNNGRLTRYEQKDDANILAVAERHRERIRQEWID